LRRIERNAFLDGNYTTNVHAIFKLPNLFSKKKFFIFRADCNSMKKLFLILYSVSVCSCNINNTSKSIKKSDSAKINGNVPNEQNITPAVKINDIKKLGLNGNIKKRIVSDYLETENVSGEWMPVNAKPDEQREYNFYNNGNISFIVYGDDPKNDAIDSFVYKNDTLILCNYYVNRIKYQSKYFHWTGPLNYETVVYKAIRINDLKKNYTEYWKLNQNYLPKMTTMVYEDSNIVKQAFEYPDEKTKKECWSFKDTVKNCCYTETILQKDTHGNPVKILGKHSQDKDYRLTKIAYEYY
jgi:hypothetical protein